MNKIWLILLIISITSLLFTNPLSVLQGLLSASNKAVTLSISLCAIYAVWMGIFSILKETSFSKFLTKLLSPIINLIFGKNNLSNESKQYVSMNMSANILGLNGAATPLGIKAIESMNKNNKTGSVTFSMTMLIILSCTSLQLFPTSLISLLSESGSTNPSAIILPSIIAGLLSTVVGIFLVKSYYAIKKTMEKRKQK